LANKYFAPIPAQKKPRAVHTVEPEQKGERRTYVQKPSVTAPNILFAYHVPATKHKDYYPLNMLASILGDGNSSRLNRSLVNEQQIATDTFTYLPESFDPNLFYVYAVAANDVSSEKLEAGIITEINKIMSEGISEKELNKVKNKAQVDFYRNLATINGKANNLGSYELYFGTYTEMFNATEKMAAVTTQDIQRVAKQYLKRANRTVGILDAASDSKAGDQ
jgi:zinc protease